MRVTQKVKKILDWYEGDPPGVKANLARILCTGKLAGTGKVVILPVDQGFEHGPARSLAPNKDQAVTAGVKDALRLGCAAVGFTIYPGSEFAFPQLEELRELTAEAKASGLAVVG